MRPVLPALAAVACVAAPGISPADSVSCGAANRGALVGGVLMPPDGPGYVVPEPWRTRGRQHGTAELVEMVRRAAAEVARRHPGAVLGVCDLSAARGGFVPGHRSHQSGRDVDLQYYARDAAGRPLIPDATLARFNRRGEARGASHPRWEVIPLRRLDAGRTWALVRALLTDPRVEVQHVFVSWSVRRLLLARARLEGDTGEVYRRAARVLRRPTGGRLHNDHLHVRIACPGGDGTRGGCRNAPAPRRARPWRWRVRCPVKTGSPLAGVRRGR